MNNIIFKNRILKRFLFTSLFVLCNVFVLCSINFGENINIGYRYGIENIAKPASVIPIELTIENRDSVKFSGYVSLSIYENNNSVYKYKKDIDIDEKGTTIKNFNITLASDVNTLIFEVYNKREEIVASERTNLDLKYYNGKMIIGTLTSNYDELAYIDGIILANTGLELKLVNIDLSSTDDLNEKLNILDMILVSDFDLRKLDKNILSVLQKYLQSGKAIIVAGKRESEYNYLPSFLSEVYKNAVFIEKFANNTYARVINNNNMRVVLLPYALNSLSVDKNASNIVVDIIEKGVSKEYLDKILNQYDNAENNDYYNISGLLNIIDKQKLPDIFSITLLLASYIFVLTILIYIYLRNSNKIRYYGRYVFAFSIIFTIIMFYFGFSMMKKNVLLTYISIVDINDASAKERAFLNFRISEGGNYNFETNKANGLYPIIRNTKDPIRNIDFMDKANIKSTTFTEDDEKKVVQVENARDFDSNIFIYDNSNYLNDIYNIYSTYERFDGMVTGRVVNNMNLTIRNAHLLLYGKILKIGDIQPNHNISLSRAVDIGSPINNNEMLADIMSSSSNHNIIKYYLDEHVYGYFDYGLLFGFIDNNGTIDINSNDVEDVYGRTLIVTKVLDNKISGIADYCAMQNDVVNVSGYYENINNTIRGGEEVINKYKFNKNALISKIYLERIDNYDAGSIDAFVPFYGEIYVYNNKTQNFDLVSDDRLTFDQLEYLHLSLFL